MQCERLIQLSKSWFLHVKNETMAPARMIAFMEKHAAECPICQKDPDLTEEIAKIRELILPESKIPKAVRMQQEAEELQQQEEMADEDNDEMHDEDDEDIDDEDMHDDKTDELINDDLI